MPTSLRKTWARWYGDIRATCREIGQRPLAIRSERHGFLHALDPARGPRAARAPMRRHRGKQLGAERLDLEGVALAARELSPEQAAANHLAGRQQVIGLRHGVEALVGLRQLRRERFAGPLQHQDLVADAPREAHAIGPIGREGDHLVRRGDELAARRRMARENALQREGQDVGARRLDVDALRGRRARNDMTDAKLLGIVEDAALQHRRCGSIHAGFPRWKSPACYADGRFSRVTLCERLRAPATRTPIPPCSA